MTQFLKIITSIAVLFVPFLSFSGDFKETKHKDGKILAASLHVSLQIRKFDKNQYFVFDDFKKYVQENNLIKDDGIYQYGTAESSEIVKKLCPDCHMNLKSFKLAIFANLDEDPDLDVFLISSEDKKVEIYRKD